MPPFLLKFLFKFWPHLIVVALLAGGAWALHHHGVKAGRAEVQIQWAAAIAKATVEAVKKEEADAEHAKKLQDELVKKDGLLAAATADGRSLAERLRNAQARACLPPAAGPAGGLGSAPGEPADGLPAQSAVDAAVEDHFAACARDAERLLGFQQWWKAVSE
jgi:hypothetical protein